MNSLHFLYETYLASFAECFNWLKRSCRGPGQYIKHCCSTTFRIQWGYCQHNRELSCHNINIRIILLVLYDFLILASSQALLPVKNNACDQHFWKWHLHYCLLKQSVDYMITWNILAQMLSLSVNILMMHILKMKLWLYPSVLLQSW